MSPALYSILCINKRLPAKATDLHY